MKVRKILVWLLVFSICLCSNVQEAAASDGSNMEKVLKYYKKGDYAKAKKYNRRLSRTPREVAVKRMSGSMKMAYQQVIAKSPKFDSRMDNGKYLWEYYLTDIDNDKKAELLRVTGSREGDLELEVWKYKNGTAAEICSTNCGHSTFHAFPNHNGIVRSVVYKNCEILYLLKVRKGKFVIKKIRRRFLADSSEMSLGCQLKSDYFNML